MMRKQRVFGEKDFAFEVGQIFRRDTTFFRITEKRGAILRLENSRTLEQKVVELFKLQLEYGDGNIIPSTREEEEQAILGALPYTAASSIQFHELPISMLSADQQRHIKSVRMCIDELRKLGYQSLRPTPLLEIEYCRLLDRLKIVYPEIIQYKLSTIYEWSLVYDQADGDVRAIIPLFNERGGKGKLRLAVETQECLQKALKDIRDDKICKIRACDLEDRVLTYLISNVGSDQAQLLNLSRSSASRAIHKEFSPYEILVRNKSKAYADRVYRDWYPRDRAERKLEVFEFDDKDSRVFLIDEKTGLPYGRGFVTVGVDQKCQTPMGFSISEQHRSVWSAMCALTASILPKDTRNSDFSLVKGSVEFLGKPGIAIFDNATYNHALEIDRAAHELSITPAWAKPRTPTEKSIVEGFNKRMDQDLFSTLPGYSGLKGDDKSFKEGYASANMSKDDFIRKLYKWAYDDYCNDPGEDGLTPRQRWHDERDLIVPRFPRDIYRLKIIPTLLDSVSLRPEGIRFCGLIYQHDYLTKLRKNLGAKVRIEFRYDPNDMSLVYVLDPLTKRLFVIPSANPEYTKGLTLYQHRLIRKMARLNRKKNPSIPELMETREELRILVEQSRISTKRSERAFSKRVGFINENNSASNKQQPPKKVEMTDLEAQVADINDIEMELGEDGWDVPELI